MLLPNEMAAEQACNFVWKKKYRLFTNNLNSSVVFLYGILRRSLWLSITKILERFVHRQRRKCLAKRSCSERSLEEFACKKPTA